jgi:Icc-related predicted phosphoesterase
MTKALFVSDLHGNASKYDCLFEQIFLEKPDALFLGGDLFPPFSQLYDREEEHFRNLFVSRFKKIKEKLGNDYPRVFIILGNDDPILEEENFLNPEYRNYWNYVNMRKSYLGKYPVYGYSYIPPTPFFVKSWERYDISEYVDPGCTHLFDETKIDGLARKNYPTIKEDLERLIFEKDMSNSILLSHVPPYQTSLDRAPLDGLFFDHVPLDLHIGSIAIRRFIEIKQPLITLHGHVHESSTITGKWMEKIGRTYSFNASGTRNCLPIIKIELENPAEAIRKEFYV